MTTQIASGIYGITMNLVRKNRNFKVILVFDKEFKFIMCFCNIIQLLTNEALDMM